METLTILVVGTGLIVFVSFGVLLDRLNHAQDALEALWDELLRQEDARQQRHGETVEALKTRRKA